MIGNSRDLKRVDHGFVRYSVLAVCSLAVALSGCANSLPSLPKVSDINPFAEKQKPLPGKRVPVLATRETLASELAPADAPVTLPAEVVNVEWSQPGGTASGATGNLALPGSVKTSWSAGAGTGSSTAGRVTASPIVVGERVFVLDAAGTVSAFRTSGGSAIWKASLVPQMEKDSGGFFSLGGSSASGGFGGGLAADEGRLYGASGFGKIAALDPASGKVIWERELSTAIRAAPTAVGGRVFVVTLEGRFYCLSGVDGTELWVSRGLPQKASLVISASPSVSGDVVVVPYPSGDLVALSVADGTPLWSENLSRSRTLSAMASLSDAARPIIDNGTVFGVGHGGRMVATSVSTGERLWSANVPGVNAPWVAGSNVFVVDTSGQLLALSRADGKIRWTVKLPDAKTWAGPVLAGGVLWLASSKGTLVGVDAIVGRVIRQEKLGSPVYIPPVVAQGRMFVFTDSARLISLN